MANEQNLINGEQTQFRSGDEAVRNGRAGGIASGKARRERKTLADALRAELDKQLEGAGMTKREYLAAKCVMNLKDDVTPNDLRVLADVLGELKQSVSVETEGMAIVVKADTAGNLAKILSNENRND